ncbi:MAG TPA: hypothetical protein VH475_21040 [Tepidisphaeraceae bacterium]|jgi:hypothetical protein
MSLRKCPACKNQVDADNEVCPVCGCNPIVWRVRVAVVWSLAAITVGWFLLHAHVHMPLLPGHH